MTTYTYLFEAKSVQTYIFATNRLKEIVGASELIESLTGKLLEDNSPDGELLRAVLATIKPAIDKPVKFSRCGGGAFYAFSTDEQAIDRLATLWSLVVRQYAPDLEFVQALGNGDTDYQAFKNTHPLLLAARNNLPVRFPQASPLAIRNRRTGEPAVGWHTTKAESDAEPLDAATLRKLNPNFWQGKNLGKRFSDAPWKSWPLNLTPESPEEDDEIPGGSSGKKTARSSRDFPFTDENNTFALIHADGNGLGQLLIKLGEVIKQQPDKYIALFAKFSKAVTEATQQAAKIATTKVLLPDQKDGVYPARPIVLGGDDLTILVRADLALAFTCCFLTAFAQESGKILIKLKAEFELSEAIPDQLTACAGIAYATSSQPLYLLHNLAESLCKHAKKRAKAINKDKVPTSLAFHRVTTAYIDNEYKDIVERELTFSLSPSQSQASHNQTSDQKPSYRQTMECYALEPNQGLPELDDLLRLRYLLAQPEFSKGAVRQLLGIIGRDLSQAPRHYQRWREVIAPPGQMKKLHQFDALLEKFGISNDSYLPYSCPDKNGIRRTPLGDAVMLAAIGDDASL